MFRKMSIIIIGMLLMFSSVSFADQVDQDRMEELSMQYNSLTWEYRYLELRKVNIENETKAIVDEMKKLQAKAKAEKEAAVIEEKKLDKSE